MNIIVNNEKSKRERNREEFLKHLKEKRKQKKANRKKNKKIEKETNENKKNNENDSLLSLNLNGYEIEYIEQLPDKKFIEQTQMQNVLDYFNYPSPKNENVEGESIENESDEDYLENTNQNNQKNKNNLEKPLSKKKLKKLKKIKLTDLKEITQFPEIVESWDTSAKDAKLLIFLKSMRNTVPVPKHWTQKKKYLQSQRGILRQQFKLPEFIESTGISKIRNIDAPVIKSLKLKMRQRMSPKLGRMDIDYQVLHDAFFKYQTKPKLSKHGDVYYENKEFENKMRSFQPGRISMKLRTALGINESATPTFVANMQRYGPPPAYPNLKIPGVNVPLLDPTAEITPNLWGLPDIKEYNELVWDYKGSSEVTNHFGELKEEDEEENEQDEDDMGNDQDDLELEDGDEKPEVEGLFEQDAEEENENNNEPMKMLSDEEKHQQEMMMNKNEEEELEEDENDGKYYKILAEQESEMNLGELHPIGYRYQYQQGNKENKMNEKEKEELNESKSVNSEKYFEGDDESEENENLGKKIF